MNNSHDDLMKALMNYMLKDENDVENEVKEIIDEYKPYIYSVCKELMSMLKEVCDHEEFFNVMANIKKKTYDAYIKVGFTEEQATMFVANSMIAYNSLKKNSEQ